LVDSQHVREIERQVDGAFDLVHQLVRSAEDVRVIEGEHSHPVEADQSAGSLVAPVVADLSDADGQLAIAAQLRLVDDYVMRAVDGTKLELLAILEKLQVLLELLR